MGGSAFTRGLHRLYVPRLAPPVYKHVHSQLATALRPLFPRIDKLIEGPEKESYGDIDILVSLEGSAFHDEQKKDPQHADAWAALEKALEPRRTRHESTKAFNFRNFALAWPKGLTPEEMKTQLVVEARHLSEQRAAAEKHKAIAAKKTADKAAKKAAAEGKAVSEERAVPEEKAETAERSESSPNPDPSASTQVKENAIVDKNANVDRYVQVDIHLCETNQELEWQKFKNSHGGIWFILGSSMRPLGLLLDNEGLQLCVRDHDLRVPKTERIFLTNNPTHVLDFLGLSYANGEWTRPFDTIADLVNYATSYRWYIHRPPLDKRKSRILTPELGKYLEASQQASSTAHESIARKSKAQQLADVRRLAFSYFPGTEKIYDDLVAHWVLETVKKEWADNVRAVIKHDVCLPKVIPAKNLPASHYTRGKAHTEQVWRQVLRLALRRLLVSETRDTYELQSVKTPKFDHTTPIPTVMNWIRDNWPAIGREVWDRIEHTLRYEQRANIPFDDAKSSKPEAAAETPAHQVDIKSAVPQTRPWAQGGLYVAQGGLRFGQAGEAGDSKAITPEESGATYVAAAAAASDAPQSGKQP